jgi:hypothetical protein
MTTYVIMRSRISDELVNEKITNAQINLAILEAVKHYKNKEFFFNQVLIDFTTVVDQEWYTTSDDSQIDDVIKLKWARVTVSSVRYQVLPRSDKWIEARQNGAVESDPIRNIAYAREQFRVYPIPTAARTVEVFAHVELAELSGDGDTNGWTTEGESLIRNRAKKILSVGTLQATDLAAMFDAFEMEALAALDSETAKRMFEIERVPEPMPLTGYGGYDINADL